MRFDFSGIRAASLLLPLCVGLMASPSFAQTSPELAMRDFASGQIKKGVRSIGFGGDDRCGRGICFGDGVRPAGCRAGAR